MTNPPQKTDQENNQIFNFQEIPGFWSHTVIK